MGGGQGGTEKGVIQGNRENLWGDVFVHFLDRDDGFTGVYPG